MTRRLMTLSGILSGVLVLSQVAVAQSDATEHAATAVPRPSFEVASIKPHTSDDRRMVFRPSPGGRMEIAGVPLRVMIRVAYDVQDFQISGGPKWMDTDRWDIVAKTGDGSDSQLAERVQVLLEDRFKLQIRRESKEMPVLALSVAKGGPKFQKDDADCPAGPQGTPAPTVPGQTPIPLCGRLRVGPGFLYGDKVHVLQIIQSVSNAVGRPVIDRTELTGRYDIKLEWTPEQRQAPLGAPEQGQNGQGVSPPMPPANSAPSIFTALQEQLGLKLEPQRAPVQMLMIDLVELPEEN
jgi:uncharacterized protein (TIGR03435 family)